MTLEFETYQFWIEEHKIDTKRMKLKMKTRRYWTNKLFSKLSIRNWIWNQEYLAGVWLIGNVASFYNQKARKKWLYRYGQGIGSNKIKFLKKKNILSQNCLLTKMRLYYNIIIANLRECEKTSTKEIEFLQLEI